MESTKDTARMIREEMDGFVDYIEREELAGKMVEQADKMARDSRHKTSVDAAYHNLQSFIRNILT